VVSFTPRPLYSRGKGVQYPLDSRQGGPESRSVRRGDVINLAPTGSQTQPLSSRYTDCSIPAQAKLETI
jgi:hypothetical protein